MIRANRFARIALRIARATKVLTVQWGGHHLLGWHICRTKFSPSSLWIPNEKSLCRKRVWAQGDRQEGNQKQAKGCEKVTENEKKVTKKWRKKMWVAYPFGGTLKKWNTKWDEKFENAPKRPRKSSSPVQLPKRFSPALFHSSAPAISNTVSNAISIFFTTRIRRHGHANKWRPQKRLRFRALRGETHRVLQGAAQRGSQFYFVFAGLRTLFSCSKLSLLYLKIAPHEGNALKHRLKDTSVQKMRRDS